MVSPILLIAVPLGIAFLLPLFDRLGRSTTRGVHLLTLMFGLVESGLWLNETLSAPAAKQVVHIFTGSWPATIGISLQLGPMEAGLVAIANLTAIGSALYLAHHEREGDLRGIVIQLLLVVGATGLIMTRDLFNTFVFLEITGIGTYAIMAFGKEKTGLEAGFKYMLLGSLASVLVLLGIAFLYKTTGTLNMADVFASASTGHKAGMGLILLLLLVGLFAEMKLFPVNGPAIDLYDGGEPGVMALLVGTTVNAVLFTFWKIQPMYQGTSWISLIASIGMLTFVTANLFAIRQKRVRRMLGYSSSAQLGLLVFLIPFIKIGQVPVTAAILLLVNHAFAKAGLLWLAGVQGQQQLEKWKGAFKRNPWLRGVLALLVLAIAGLPPFPGFWGKWQALVGLAHSPNAWWIAPLLVGSLLEFAYYFGFLRRVFEPDSVDVGEQPAHLGEVTGPVISALALVGVGAVSVLKVWPMTNPVFVLMVAGGILVVAAVGAGTELLQAVVSLGGVLYIGYAAFSHVHAVEDLYSLRNIFLLIALTGGLVVSVAALGFKGQRRGYHGLFMILLASIVGLMLSDSLLGFFAGWELMTWSSYLLITQGRKGAKAGYLYMLFSGAAGFLVLGGLMFAIGNGANSVADLAKIHGDASVWAWSLLALGFLVKVASWGAHVWAPGAYSEAPDGFTPFLSGVISKVPMFGFAVIAGKLAINVQANFSTGALDPTYILAWLGAITALGMTLLAVFQDDAKKLLAYSSVGQVGYIVLALAIMSPLGWTAGVYHAMNHMLFKGLLFVAIAGVVYRTGTRKFSEMGGLIARMPVSFVAVLVGIITLAGIPPLSGFAGKWMLYEALMDRGWFLLAGVAMFASVIAFMYCYRLIHSIFLGQLKSKNRDLKAAPLPVQIAELGLIGAILAVSFKPEWAIEPIQHAVTKVIPGSSVKMVAFGTSKLAEHGTGFKMMTSFGTYEPLNMMIGVLGVMLVVFLFLVVVGPKVKKVKQLDIVYAGEVPPPPEEIHYAAGFFMHYSRAFAPVLKSQVIKFWDGVRDAAQAVGDVGRRMYTGDAQTYILYPMMLIVVLAAMGFGL